jgi:uncharacterized protein (UPF0333 family)
MIEKAHFNFHLTAHFNWGMLMKIKAQGALEYLFVTAVTLLLVAISLKYFQTTTEKLKETAQKTANAVYNTVLDVI